MDHLAKRLAALTPAQRELLARRLEQGGPNAAQTQAAQTQATLAPVQSARGAADDARADVDAGAASHGALTRGGGGGAMQFSLFFFSADGQTTARDKYRLLTESAKFADAHGFSAVWTPERHFQAFGGLYPNPSLLGAALAVITERVQIRAGSVALPLHHPVRVAEEWSVVDNLSRGRAGVSFASGWHAEDFALAPANYEDRKEIMFRGIETIRRLWAGESIREANAAGREVEVKLVPRPVQARLPVWVTSSGSRDTWARAGAIGANVLSGLKGDPRGELAQKIALYRDSLARHGHDPRAGQVTVMLHTFVGPETAAVKEQVRAPLTKYLRTFIEQGEQSGRSGESGQRGGLREGDKDALAAMAFETFFNTSSLLGSPEKCSRLVERLKEVGVDEIACLVDFGLDTETILAGLRRLNELRALYSRARAATYSEPI